MTADRGRRHDRHALRGSPAPSEDAGAVLAAIQALTTEIRALSSAVHTLRDTLHARLPAHDAAPPVTRHVTQADVDAVVRRALQQYGLGGPPAPPVAVQPTATRVVQPHVTPPAEPPVTTGEAPTRRRRRRGEASPSVLPDGTVAEAWEQWFCADPPLRFLRTPLARDDQRRRSDLNYLMAKLQSLVPGFPATPTPTIQEARDAYRAACASMELPTRTPSGRTRSIDRLKWTSAVPIFRSQDKQRNAQRESHET